MPQKYFITPTDGPPDETDPGYGQGRPRPPHASLPIVLPALPGIWPPPGKPNWPPAPVDPNYDINAPIFIQGRPDTPIALPPGVYPPLPPITEGKYAVLILVIGVGYRWLVVEGSDLSQPK